MCVCVSCFWSSPFQHHSLLTPQSISAPPLHQHMYSNHRWLFSIVFLLFLLSLSWESVFCCTVKSFVAHCTRSTHSHAHTHTYMYTYIHAYTHTHARTLSRSLPFYFSAPINPSIILTSHHPYSLTHSLALTQTHPLSLSTILFLCTHQSINYTYITSLTFSFLSIFNPLLFCRDFHYAWLRPISFLCIRHVENPATTTW